MIRNGMAGGLCLSVLVLVAGTAIVNCSRGSSTAPRSGATGSVGFDLKLSSTAEITAVRYRISGNGITPIAGAIDVSTFNNARALVTGIPVGTAYLIELTAVSTDGKTTCTGMTTFNVIDGETADAKIILQCKPTTVVSGTGGAADGGTDGPRDAAAGTGGSGTGGAGTGGGGTGGAGTGGAGVGGAATGGSGTGGAGTGGSGTGGAAGMGGAGTGGAAGMGGAGGGCVATHCAGAVCDQCTADNCVPDTDGCDTLTDPTDRQLCQDAYACFVDPASVCVTPAGDPIKCWCGDRNPITTCATSDAPGTQANGPCLQQVFAAAKSMLAATVKQRFVDPGFPIGRAVNLVQCRGNFCSTECPFR